MSGQDITFYLRSNHLKSVTAMELISIFERCHNYIYANEGLLKEKVFNEVLKLIFMKMADEKSSLSNRRFYVTTEELKNLKEGKDSFVVERILTFWEEIKGNYPDIFPDPHERINLKPLTLAYIVSLLQKYNFSETSADAKGAAFQTFVYAHMRGSRGEFFTPPPIIELAVNILDPKPNEKVIDPACGSGGFLVETLKWIKRNAQLEIGRYSNTYAGENLCGIDIVPELVRVTKMRLMLYGNGHEGIFTANSLLPFDQLVYLAEKSNIPRSLIPNQGSFDVLMTNPPFGTKGKITDKTILKTFDLGYKWVKKGGKWVKTNRLADGVAPEVLFIERCLQLLKDGGRMAIVLPDGILENPSQGYIREFIKAKAKILAIIKLPPETFIPYGTGINASILFLQKFQSINMEVQECANHDVFFGVIEKIGYEGTKNGKVIYKRDEKGEIIRDPGGNPVIDEDVTEVIRAYNAFKENKTFHETSKIFLRKYSEIEDRWDVKFYKPEYKRLRMRLLKAGSMPLGDVADIVSKKAKILENPEATIRYVELSDVNPATSELVSYSEMKVYAAPSRAKYEIKEGDILIAVAGNSVGTENNASAYVTKEFDGCICSNGFRVLRPKKVDPLYLLWFLRTKAFLMQMYQFRTGAAIPAVSDSDLKRILIPIPEKEVQEEISLKMRTSYELRRKSREITQELQRMMDAIVPDLP
ncbi:MAG: N-6 DNA methylase [Candidatus Jordarchaeaceae archaeon]